jgi:hypothetical protein
MLSDIIGRGISVTEDRLEGAAYHLYGGFRNVDLDLRAPLTDVESEDTSSSSMFLVSWAGVDTTLEDGIGWGVRRYWIQWSKSSDPGNWHDWHLATTMTNDWFGPFEPETVKQDTVYFFRMRADDLAGNISDYPAIPQASTMFQPPILDFTVRQIDGDSVWRPDTIAEADQITTDFDQLFIVTNNTGENVDVGLYSFNTAHWELANEPGRDAFALHAIMNDLREPPNDEDFDSLSRIGPTSANLRWASPDTFGPGGVNISSEGPDNTENLWLHLKAPTWVTRYGGYDDEIVLIKVQVRATAYP